MIIGLLTKVRLRVYHLRRRRLTAEACFVALSCGSQRIVVEKFDLNLLNCDAKNMSTIPIPGPTPIHVHRITGPPRLRLLSCSTDS
jgi:hypothetical protein